MDQQLDPSTDPIDTCRDWLLQAEQAGLRNANAMSLATIDPDGRPSARIVLLKHLDERGAVFFTNRSSRKGLALSAHPQAAMVLHWETLQRQIRMEGAVAQTTDDESDAYFASRPRSFQLAAWASPQSDPIAGRQTLTTALAQLEARFEGQEVARPPHWGGYRVALDRIEFWVHRESRLHDRLLYTRRPDGGWSTQAIGP
jgi:pyridoxamine 5'-phosphate oxidase